MHVPESVASMLAAKLLIIVLFVAAMLGSLEIHLFAVSTYRYPQTKNHLKILAFLLRAGLHQFVKILEVFPHAHVNKITLELHQIVVRNALFTRNVLVILLVFEVNVQTLAQVHVGNMQHAVLSNILQSALVHQVSPGIHSLFATLNNHNLHYLRMSVIHPLVDQMPIAAMEFVAA